MARITILSLDISARALCLGEIYYPGFFFFYRQGTESQKERVKSATADLSPCTPGKQAAVENALTQ